MSKSSPAVQFVEIAREHHARTSKETKTLWCELCCYSTEHQFAGKAASRPRELHERWQCSLCGLIKTFTIR
jgi:hypothetical protein